MNPPPLDRGTAAHHWVLALVLGVLTGGAAVLLAWLVVRALF